MTGYFNSIGGVMFTALYKTVYNPISGYFESVLASKDSGFWTVPQGVTKIHAVAIGGGGGGGGLYTFRMGRSAGGGGALSCTDLYSDVGISVTPGETLEVKWGYGGNRGLGGYAASNTLGNGTDGGDSYIKRGSTYLLLAKGGSGGSKTVASAGPQLGGQASAGIGDIKFSGGVGGTAIETIRTARGTGSTSRVAGGGGAGGFLDNGGDGAPTGVFTMGYDYQSEASNGGYYSWGGAGFSPTYLRGDITKYDEPFGSRGFGQPRYTYVNWNGIFQDLGLAGGTSLDAIYWTPPTPPSPPRAGDGGLFGGGGGAGELASDGVTYGDGGYGAGGCVRIIWGPSRRIPDDFVGDYY
jgi:hypothetical protein